MNAKRKIIGICLLCIILVGTLCSCVDFEGELVQTNEVKLEYILGDVDLNGFHEKVVLGKDEFSLYNGSRLVKSYKLEEDMEYISVSGMYGDINGDSMSDIIVLLKGQDNIYDVFVL